MTALEVIAEILRINPLIGYVSLATFQPPAEKQLLSGSPERFLRHNSVLSRTEVVRDDFLGKLTQTAELMSKERNLAFVSVVKISETTAFQHVPLMDFKCEKKGENLTCIRTFLQAVGQRRGVILDSGRSYHYYGVDTLLDAQWRRFMAQCLLFDFTDRYYIGHQQATCPILL